MDDTLNDNPKDDELKESHENPQEDINSDDKELIEEKSPSEELESETIEMNIPDNSQEQQMDEGDNNEIGGGENHKDPIPLKSTQTDNSKGVIGNSSITARDFQLGDQITKIEKLIINTNAKKEEKSKIDKDVENKKNDRKEEVKDLTELVKSDIIEISEIDYPDFEKHCEKLNERRFVILNCVDDKVLYGLQNRVVKYFGGYEDSYEIRSLSYNKIREEYEEIESLGLSLFKERKIGSGRKTITFIENPTISFIKSIHLGVNYFQNFISYLKEKDMIIICLMSQSKNDINKDLFDLRRYIINVPFLESFIKRYYEDEEDAQRIIKKINESKLQRNFTDRGLYDILKEELEERYSDFEHFINEDNKVISKNESEYQLLISAFNSKDKIKKIVLFVGAYFKDLNYRDFKLMVDFFLEGETEIIIKDKKNKKKKREEEVTLMKRWSDKDDKILGKCQMVFNEHNGEHIMQFEHVDFQEKLKKHIKRKGMPIVQKQLDKIKRANLLFKFESNLSNRLMSNIIRLFVESTQYEIDIYNKDWLIGLVLQLKNVLETHEQESIDFSKNSYEQFIELLELMEKNNRLAQFKKQFFRRLVDLIHEMYEQDFNRFKKVVDEFLQGLIDKNLGKFSVEIILEIFRKLKRDERFDTKKWLQHILHQEKNPQIREEAFSAMMKIFDMDELKEIMNSLLPEKEGEIKNNLNAFALRFQLEYCRETILRFDQSRIGIIPSEYELLSQLESKDSLKSKELEEVLGWIYDDKTDYVFEKYFDYLNWNKTIYMGEIIEIWFVFLYGLKPISPLPSENKVAIDNFLQLIIKSAGVKKARQLVKYWVTKMSNGYGAAIAEESQKLKDEIGIIQSGDTVITVNIVKGKKENFVSIINEIKNRRSVLKTLIKETNYQINKMKNHVK